VLAVLFVIGYVGGQRPTGGDPDSASPSATRAAQPTPRPTTTATPTPEATPQAFAPITLEGRGDDIVPFTIPESAAAIVSITHAGERNFVVQTLGADGEQYDLLVNEIGDYSGTRLFDTVEHSVAFEVSADGSWTAVVKPVSEARPWNGESQLTGSTDDVVRVTGSVDGLATVLVIHDGDANFVVVAYSGQGNDLLINEIGQYRGEVLLPVGTVLIELTANGPWSVTPQ
jgi:hypothetical protein